MKRLHEAIGKGAAFYPAVRATAVIGVASPLRTESRLIGATAHFAIETAVFPGRRREVLLFFFTRIGP